MITLSDIQALQEDRPEEAAKAYAAGWRIDEDYWWVRPLHAGDPAIVVNDGFICDGHVFVTGAGEALSFDGRGAKP